MSDDDEPFEELLRIETKHESSETILVLEGEFDMTGTASFWSHVSDALAMHSATIVVEARGLTFIDSSGVAALVRARDAAAAAGVPLPVRDPSPPLRRIAELMGLERSSMAGDTRRLAIP
jgi:anti-sigma B factor antagonist